MSITEQIVTDKKGKPVAVQIPVEQYKKLLELAEEMEDIRAFDKGRRVVVPPGGLNDGSAAVLALGLWDLQPLLRDCIRVKAPDTKRQKDHENDRVTA